MIPRKEFDKRREQQRKKRRRIVTIAAVAAAVILLVVFFAKGGYEKLLDILGIERNIAVTPKLTEVECNLKGGAVVGGIGGTTILYDEQGITGYATDGKWKWNEPCTLENPVISYIDGSVIFADVGGTVIYAFNADGMVWRYGSDSKIKSVFGNPTSNYICVVHEEKEYLSAVTVFEHQKKSKELTQLFTRKFGTHHMLTGAVLEDGKQLAVSGVYSTSGDPAGVMSFIRMSDGEIYSNEIFDNDVYVKLFYADNGKIFAVNSDSMRVLYHALSNSSKDDSNREIWNRQNGQNKMIDAVLLNGKYCVAAFRTESSEKTTVKGYDTAGKESLNFEVAGNIIGMHSVGDALLLYTNRSIYLYNERGLLLGTLEAGFEIGGAICTDSRHVTAYGENKVISVSFQ